MTNEEPSRSHGSLRLDHFLKRTAISGTGGESKYLIQSGEVKVNREIETRRRRKLAIGDIVELGGKQFVVNELHICD